MKRLWQAIPSYPTRWSNAGAILLGVLVLPGVLLFSACGIESAGNTGAWLPADDHGGEVWCTGNNAGGLSCNWDQYNKKNGIK